MDNMKLPNGVYKKTHVYQDVDYEKPKYVFSVLGDKIEKVVSCTEKLTMLDVGGASGAFCHYIGKRFSSKIETICVEFDEELCHIGRENVQECRFICGDANNMDMIRTNTVNIVTMIGVLSIFDNFKPSLSECFRVVVPGGNVFVFGKFNEYDIDILLRYRYCNNDIWNRGWNLFSKYSIDTFLRERTDIKKWSYEKFRFPFDLEKKDDPIRSWTEINTRGERIFKNGLNMEINLQMLHITMKGES
jgi:ubiquinone/menaquinone biosynthesis C-methylase UbiE|tara:strand:+ start:531 stop:1268 length:738 start_codon:yes stop_codon:yes gene_type:complete